MKITALQIAAGGGFDTVTRIDLNEREPGPAEIRVRLRASSLNFHDLGVVSGATAPREPRIPLSDGAGDVIAVGAQVTEFAVGDRVVSTFFPDWFDGDPHAVGFARTPGDGIDGFARTEVTMPVSAFTRAPAGYSHAEAATRVIATSSNDDKLARLADLGADHLINYVTLRTSSPHLGVVRFRIRGIKPAGHRRNGGCRVRRPAALSTVS
ncbi:alcohol dehydrogenase catalytic domain-containing protein [Rhodococcus sp. NPDC127530]|uniref:alcohol dehydrogenase catalytic domain-containing protein n=1 Tax=unclassified Rhodococcus (in: high G+C Gram-positive bacteria) TaxID=192944 RepID=UPI00362D2B5C